jgi:hypothetical protein
MTGFATRVTRRVPHSDQELPTLPEHLSSPSGFSGVRVSRSLVLCVMFCRSGFLCCLSFDLQILITPLISSSSSLLKVGLMCLDEATDLTADCSFSKLER